MILLLVILFFLLYYVILFLFDGEIVNCSICLCEIMLNFFFVKTIYNCMNKEKHKRNEIITKIALQSEKLLS